MLKLQFNKNNINMNKLHAELGDLSEEFMLTYSDVEFNLMFPELKEYEKDTGTKYQKKSYQTVKETDDDGMTTEKQVEVWTDYTTEVEALISVIKQAIVDHDPTPIPEPPTIEEKVKMLEMENINLMLASVETYEMMCQENINLMLAMAELYETIGNGGVGNG